MVYTTPSVSYCTGSDIAVELDLTIVSGSGFTLWGKPITGTTLTNYANRGNDKVYSLVGDVTASTTYKNNLAVRLASLYGARDLVTSYTVHMVDYAFNFSIGQQSIQRGTAALEGVKVLQVRLDNDIRDLEFKIAATASGEQHDDSDRKIYTDFEALPYLP